MKIVVLSNFFNHHQKPVSDVLYKLTSCNFIFVETTEMADEQSKLGYEKYNEPYVVRYNSSTSDYIDQQILEADAVIFGEAPLKLIKPRLKIGLLTFRDDERRYKSIIKYLKYPIYTYNSLYLNQGYLLCSSAFAPRDYRLSGMRPEKCFKWGYFTDVKSYPDISGLIESKPGNCGNPVSILWACRMIGWKHPEYAIDVARRLKSDNVRFTMSLIGRGPLEGKIESLILKHGLSTEVKLLGPMSPVKVRERMEKADIFLSTSDRNEGWGATVNEALNSACAVVADSMIGSVPYLVEHNVNGLIYHTLNKDELYSHVRSLIDDPIKRKSIAMKAYETMTGKWNAAQAGNNLIKLIESIRDHKTNPISSGPCSPAMIMKHNWM